MVNIYFDVKQPIYSTTYVHIFVDALHQQYIKLVFSMGFLLIWWDDSTGFSLFWLYSIHCCSYYHHNDTEIQVLYFVDYINFAVENFILKSVFPHATSLKVLVFMQCIVVMLCDINDILHYYNKILCAFIISQGYL